MEPSWGLQIRPQWFSILSHYPRCVRCLSNQPSRQGHCQLAPPTCENCLHPIQLMIVTFFLQAHASLFSPLSSPQASHMSVFFSFLHPHPVIALLRTGQPPCVHMCVWLLFHFPPPQYLLANRDSHPLHLQPSQSPPSPSPPPPLNPCCFERSRLNAVAFGMADTEEGNKAC